MSKLNYIRKYNAIYYISYYILNFIFLQAQYGMDDHGNFREQSAAAMQRAVYAGEMSVADYYERQVIN